MLLKPGTRLRSTVCTTEIIVVRAPAEDVELGCGGSPVIPIGEEPPAGGALDPAFAGPTKLGKRYADAEGGLELLCTKGGDGALSLAGQPLPEKDAKPLPASD
jgi:hypothetical protein